MALSQNRTFLGLRAPETAREPVSLALFSLLIAWGLYTRGLLADYHQFLGVAVFGPAVFLLLAWGWPRLPLRDWRTWSLGLFLLTLVLPVAWAAHRSHAVLGAMLALTILGVYALGYRLAQWPGARYWLSVALAALAAATSLFGILVLAGMAEYPNAYSHIRLGSTLQYPNVLAALAGAGFLAALALPRPEGLVGWRQPFLFLNALALLLTDSRGGVAAFGAALLGFAVVSLRRYPRLILVAGVHLAAAAAVFLRIRALAPGPDQLPEPQIATLALLGLAAATVVGLVAEWLLRWAPRWVSWLLLAAAGAAGGALAVRLLPDLLPRFARLGFEEASTAGRVANLVDAGRALLRYPFGLGYMGWNSVYPSVQQFGYSINIAHSYPAEVAVAQGFPGLLGLVAIWAGAAWGYWRLVWSGAESPGAAGGAGQGGPPHALFWALAMLGLHSLIDADFHFVAVFFPVVLIWGAFHGATSGAAAPSVRAAVVRPGLATQGALVALALAVGLAGWFLHLGAREAAAAARLVEEGNYAPALKLARRAQRHNPFQPEAFGAEASARTQLVNAGADPELLEGVAALWQRAVALEPYSSVFKGNYGAYLAAQGELEEAEAYLTEAVRLAPWDESAWEERLNFHAQAAVAYLRAGMAAEGLAHVQKAHQVLTELERQKEQEPPNTPKQFQFNVDTPRLQSLREVLAKLPQP